MFTSKYTNFEKNIYFFFVHSLSLVEQLQILKYRFNYNPQSKIVKTNFKWTRKFFIKKKRSRLFVQMCCVLVVFNIRSNKRYFQY